MLLGWPRLEAERSHPSHVQAAYSSRRAAWTAPSWPWPSPSATPPTARSSAPSLSWSTPRTRCGLGWRRRGSSGGAGRSKGVEGFGGVRGPGPGTEGLLARCCAGACPWLRDLCGRRPAPPQPHATHVHSRPAPVRAPPPPPPPPQARLLPALAQTYALHFGLGHLKVRGRSSSSTRIARTRSRSRPRHGPPHHRARPPSPGARRARSAEPHRRRAPSPRALQGPAASCTQPPRHLLPHCQPSPPHCPP
jgi:hypothetical protein